MPEDDVVWYERVVFEDAMLRGHFSFRGDFSVAFGGGGCLGPSYA